MKKLLLIVSLLTASAFSADPAPAVADAAVTVAAKTVTAVPGWALDWISNFAERTEIGGGYGAYYSHNKLDYGPATMLQANLFKGNLGAVEWKAGPAITLISGHVATREGVGASISFAFQPQDPKAPAPVTFRQRVVHTLTGAKGYIEAGVLVDEPTAPQVCAGLSFHF